MPPIDYARLIAGLLPAVTEAARIQLAYRSSGFAVQHKADASPVTAADRESETVITAALTAVMPEATVIGEEAASEGRIAALTPSFFLVDPLDGTREFVNGSDEFTINIALIQDRVPVFGIVAAPALDEIFLTTARDRAVAGRLTSIRDAATGAAALAALAAHEITTRVPDLTRLTVIASRTHRSQRLEDALARLSGAEKLAVGSSLKFCRLAEGRADVYPRLGEISEWDTAAGHAVVVAAGGAVTTVEGAPLVYGKAAGGFIQPPFVAWGRHDLARHISFA